MKLNLATLRKLNKFSSLTTHDLTLPVVHEVLGMVNLSMSDEVAEPLLERIKSGEDEALIDWLLDGENQGMILENVHPVKQKMTVCCPTCDEMAQYDFAEAAELNPHVVCKFCSAVIPLA